MFQADESDPDFWANYGINRRENDADWTFGAKPSYKEQKSRAGKR
jgi:hypothetical protein